MANEPHVVWTIRAERRLRQMLVRQQVQTGSPAAPGGIMADLNRVLALAFPNAHDLVVHDQHLGYRVRESEYILLVEVHDDEESGHYVVKVKDAKALEREWQAWRDCRPPGLRHDIVFMTLERVVGPDGQLAAIVYQDAQQFIGVDRTAFLEEAFLSSVTHGAPTPESLANVLTELFARVGHLQYQGASPVEPANDNVYLNAGKTIDRYFDVWEQGGAARSARRIAIAALPSDQADFFDPILCCQFILANLRAGKPACDYVPRLLRGAAHGDLHGRNVLVGLVENQAHWPALFDYEDMAKDNLLGWDFAKLETELKIRAYPQVFAGLKLLDFAAAIFRFESALCEATELHRRDGSWPSPGGAVPEERLLNLLLVLRKLAAYYLGDAHQRPGEWLEEFYFLLGCYGVSTGRFENLKEMELIGAFQSAGVALARYAYGRKEAFTEDAMPDDIAAILDRTYCSYQAPVRPVWLWNREATATSLQNAEELARALKSRYPHVLAIRFELAFALVCQERRAQAIEELRSAGKEFPVLDEDCLCLLGRCHKDEGDSLLERGAQAAAERAYRDAEESYEKAYALRHDRFPGINLAGLRLIRASLLTSLITKEPGRADTLVQQAQTLRRQSEELAKTLLSQRDGWQERLGDDNIWIPATEAEAHLLQQNWETAEQLYRQALSRPNLQAYHPETMKAQVERLLAAFARLEIGIPGPLAAPGKFFAKPA